MFPAEKTSPYGGLTVEQARVMRADQARLAALYADRVEEARAAGHSGGMAHWLRQYRRSAARCRLLGEQIREAPCDSHAPASEPERTVARLAPRPSTIAAIGEGARADAA
jgi:hypothetical protein